ncbi:GGDEF domain-containing protein [Aureimonas leprariae]|uniref:diguanylate cyclase n=1 Tax=Plantimonas leprariae TaxID=2615207 RepID=A0A7V7TV34_9HYPH|nr:diguanylate cyclase [Aureimonas leprariae]KAB0677196.1 diguanylate cyclase [Aureimonas leprariae]
MSLPAAPSLAEARPLAKWLRVFSLVIAVAVVAMAAASQFKDREARFAKSEVDAGMLASSLSQHATDTFEIANVLLTTLAERLRTSPGRSLDDIYLLDTALETQLRSVMRIRSLIAFDRNGRQFVSSQPQIPDWFDLSGDAAFRFHEENFGDAIHIGSPVRSPSTNDWLVTVTRRWDDANGQFGGVVMATIRVDYFSGFYDNFSAAGEVGISLLRGDGVLLARYPVNEAVLGRNLIYPQDRERTVVNKVGIVRSLSPVDGLMRVYAFERIDEVPLVMYAGISERSILAGWLQDCVATVAGACVLAALLGFVGWRFAAQIDARQASERKWTDLALTDGLTGVRNRRAFDEALERESAAAGSNRRPLSMILVDVDHFKAFNDTYGHPAGDSCLKAIAGALDRALTRPGDCVARYGGEEFALLLTDTGPAGALVIAERVRQAVLMLGIAHKASRTLPLVSVSVGVATEASETDEAADAVRLLDRADRALYRAKTAGRNRVEMASPAATVRAEDAAAATAPGMA